MISPTRQVDIGFTGARPSTPGHICLIYSSDDVRDKVAGAYMTAGLQRGESVRYLTDSTDPERVREWLINTGLALDVPAKSDAFAVIQSEDAYYPQGYFDPVEMIERLKARYKKTAEAGYIGTRSCGEMGWLLKGIPGSDRILEYEALLNTAFHPFPHSGMCQYDARRFDGATLFKVLQLHPQIIA
ncbi:MAG: hypothetical protein FIA97_09690, partial [Methylococcaceae bacterium]|nr:hypothetical protein [Methylococcaceae bacterium]